jgi:hypothetical protein
MIMKYIHIRERELMHVNKAKKVILPDGPRMPHRLPFSTKPDDGCSSHIESSEQSTSSDVASHASNDTPRLLQRRPPLGAPFALSLSLGSVSVSVESIAPTRIMSHTGIKSNRRCVRFVIIASSLTITNSEEKCFNEITSGVEKL